MWWIICVSQIDEYAKYSNQEVAGRKHMIGIFGTQKEVVNDIFLRPNENLYKRTCLVENILIVLPTQQVDT